MARTTEIQVKEIIEEDVTFKLQPFIDAASILVDKMVASTDTDYNETTDAAQLEMIERWLSAHFYAIAVPRVASEKAAVVAQSNQYKLGLNLAVTMYGQQAMMIDDSQYLANKNKAAVDGSRTKVGVIWAGDEDQSGVHE